MTDFETLKSTLKEEILKELSSKTEGHELKARKTKKNEKDVEEQRRKNQLNLNVSVQKNN